MPVHVQLSIAIKYKEETDKKRIKRIALVVNFSSFP